MPQEALMYQRETIRNEKLPYLRYVPRAYGSVSNQKWPLILFLHGAGERGDNLELIKKHGLPKTADGMDLPFVVISPQCPANHWWSDFTGALEDLVRQAVQALDVDPEQVYLTGLSMGGFGTWHMLVEYPHLFAAAAPICGGAAWPYGIRERVHTIKHLPIWVFHGAKDDVVPVRESQEMVDLLKECGADVRFTCYPDAKHDSWSETYQDPRLYEWFLSHRRNHAGGKS